MSTFQFTTPSPTESEFNHYQLFESIVLDELQQREPMLEDVRGSLSTVLDNDVQTKFQNARARFNPTPEQCQNLAELEAQFRYVEDCIDPERLEFTLLPGQDGDLCLSRRSPAGLITLLLPDDGTLAFSFIASAGGLRDGRVDAFEFFNDPEQLNWRQMAFRFFQW